MKLSVIENIQKKCIKFNQNSDRLGMAYGADMVAFYDLLDNIDLHFNWLNDGVKITTTLPEKLLPLVEGYLNMFCETADCSFSVTKCSDKVCDNKEKIWVAVKMKSLITDRVFKNL